MSAASDKTLFEPGRNCWKTAHAQRCAVLIDAAAYFAAFREAVARAQHQILILSWDIDSRLRLVRDDRDHELPTVLWRSISSIGISP